MFNFIWKIKHSVISSWLISYAVVLLIPLTVSVYAYYQVTNVLEDEIRRSNTYLLSKIQQGIDSMASRMEGLAVELLFSDDIVSNIAVAKPVKDEDYYNFNQVCKKLQTLKAVNHSIDDFYLYNPNLDLVFTAERIVDRETFYRIFHTLDGDNYEKWETMLLQKHTGYFFNIKGDGEKAEEYLAYVKTRERVGKNGDYINIVVLLNKERFIKEARNFEYIDQGNLSILDEDGRVIMNYTQGAEQGGYDYRKLSEANGMVESGGKRSRWMITYQKSESMGWNYVLELPKITIFERLNQSVFTILFTIFICLVLGFAAIFFVLKRNYKPIAGLIDVFGINTKHRNEVDEFTYLKQNVLNAMSEKNKMNREMDQQNALLRNNFLYRLLNGISVTGIGIKESLKKYSIAFNDNDFVVLLFKIYECGEFGHKAQEANEEMKLVHLVLNNVISETINERFTAAIVEIYDDEIMACIVNLENAENEIELALIEQIKKSEEFIFVNFGIEFNTSVSSVCHSLKDITNGYKQAITAMEYLTLNQTRGIIQYGMLERCCKGNYYYPIEIEQQLINLVKLGEEEKACALFEEVVQNNLDRFSISLEMLKCLMIEISGTLLKAYNQIFVLNMSNAAEIEPMQNILEFESIQEMKCEIRRHISEYCMFVNRNSGNKAQQWKIKIEKFVSGHYMDMNLSNQSIAEHFGIKPSYLSTLYKKQSGRGLLDYINEFRCDKAKERIEQGYRDLESVALEVGFTSKRALVRVFTKINGISPMRYMEMTDRR